MNKKLLIIKNVEYSVYYDVNKVLQESYGEKFGIQEHNGVTTTIKELDPMDKKYGEFIYIKPYNELLEAIKIMKEEFDLLLNSDYQVEFGIKNRKIYKVVKNNESISTEKSEFMYIYIVYDKNLEMICTQTILKSSLNDNDVNAVLKIIQEDCTFVLSQKETIDFENKHSLIFNSYSSGTLFHEVFGHFLESDNYKFSKIYNIKQICPSQINIYENYKSKNSIDDYGYPSVSDITLITDGIVKNTLSLGNYQTEEFERIPIPRMRSMFIKSNNSNVIEFDNNCIAIDDILFAECNYYTGDIMLVVSKARICNQGSISYVNPFSITFNVQFFSKFSLYVNDVYEEHKRLCGKNGSIITLRFLAPSIKIIANEYIKIQGV